eukprot:1161044-Pelagomonas_calceolata.AAC.1
MPRSRVVRGPCYAPCTCPLRDKWRPSTHDAACMMPLASKRHQSQKGSKLFLLQLSAHSSKGSRAAGWVRVEVGWH